MSDGYQLDATDLSIIELLAEDGRLSAMEIASRIGQISERTIRNRLSGLLERRLIHIGAMPDPTVTGDVIADVLIQVEPGRVYDVVDQLVDFDCISYVACTSGEYDITVALEAPTTRDLHEFVVATIGMIPGVRKTTIVMLLGIYKTYSYKTKTLERMRQQLAERRGEGVQPGPAMEKA